MKKTIKGRRWNKGEPCKGSLNEAKNGSSVLFYEKDTKDTVQIDFIMTGLERDAEYSLAAAKMLARKGAALRQECDLAECFLKRKFLYKDRYEVKEYTFEVGNMVEQEDGSYFYR